MKKHHIAIGSLVAIAFLVSFTLFYFGCGQQGGSGGGGSYYDPGSGGGGSGDPYSNTVTLSSLFDVSGAKAIVSAASSQTSANSIRAKSSSATELLKLLPDGTFKEILSSSYGYRPSISVIEKGPDGSLYVGFSNKLYYSTGSSNGNSDEDKTPTDTTSGGATASSDASSIKPKYVDSEGAAFFKVKTDGSIEVVDSSISGMGSWYNGGGNQSELPAKIVQFDDAGNLYYLASSGDGMDATSVLKKKTTAGTISQIGSSNMAVRDFLVAPDGFVLFHGSNKGNWSIEWLRSIAPSGSPVNNIFYNDTSGGGEYGYLRTYYLDKNGDVYLVGQNLRIVDPVTDEEKKYSGIIRVSLNSSGTPTAVNALYDDNNMYNDTYSTIGDQLTWGYWNGTEQKKFFEMETNMSTPQLPLVLASGVTDASIREHIRSKYQNITTDTLNSITFEGFSPSNGQWIVEALNTLVSANISGTTWATWRSENGLQGVSFGNAKQILFADDGSVYAVMKLDSWTGSSATKGDRVYKIVNSHGEAAISAFTQDSTYKTISRAKCFGNYLIYLASKMGYYKIFKHTLSNPSAPEDMTSDKDNVEIFNFNYNSANGKLMYDVYDLNTNTSYMVEQLITNNVAEEKEAEGYTITDVVPFVAQ